MLTKTEIGMPIVMRSLTGTLVGRIVAFEEEGPAPEAINIIHGGKLYSKVRISTPHGTVIRTGIFHLNHPDALDLERLKDCESQAERSLKGEPLYAGYDIGYGFMDSGLGHS